MNKLRLKANVTLAFTLDGGVDSSQEKLVRDHLVQAGADVYHIEILDATWADGGPLEEEDE